MNSGTAVITGGAGHLGQAIAESLASRGLVVVLSDLSIERVEEAVATIKAKERNADSIDIRGCAADVADEESVARLMETAALFGGIDVVVNNAGVEGPVATTDALDLNDLRAVYEVNVLGTLSVIKQALPHLRSSPNARVVNIASGAGLAGAAYMTAYNSSKHAVVGITRCVARELAADGIPVNAVCPGCVSSPMMGRIEREMARLGGTASVTYESAIPAGRYADAAEVANLVGYLATEAPKYLTGAALLIDGGLYA